MSLVVELVTMQACLFMLPRVVNARLLLRFMLLGLIGAMTLTGCNLGTSQEAPPPTLAPRATATPPPTLGFSGEGFTQNVGLEDVRTPIADPGVELRTLIDQVDTDRMRVHIQALQGFQTRHVNSPMNTPGYGIGAARKYINDEFALISQASGGNLAGPYEHVFDSYVNDIRTQQANVFAVIQGTETAAGIYLIGAHYDSIGPDFSNPDIFAPGANDNGSGVAGLLEIARILSQRRYRATLIFVAFSAEEHNRQGSIAFVRDIIRGQNYDLKGMINIDTIGNQDDRNGEVDDTNLRVFSDGPNDVSLSRQMAREAEMISDIYGLDMQLIVEDRIDRENRYGDHFSFSEAGYPAIRFISAKEQWPNGSASDTVEFVEFSYLRRATQSIMTYILVLADGPRLRRCDIVLRDLENGNQSLLWDPLEEATRYVVALRWPGELRYDQRIYTQHAKVDWDGFRTYEGITVAAQGANGLVGPFCNEVKIR